MNERSKMSDTHGTEVQPEPTGLKLIAKYVANTHTELTNVRIRIEALDERLLGELPPPPDDLDPVVGGGEVRELLHQTECLGHLATLVSTSLDRLTSL
jgi:hypothetical protein